MNRISPQPHQSPHDPQIDATLRLITRTEPRPGLPGRVLAHLQSAEATVVQPKWQFPFVPRVAMGWMAATAVSAAVLYGTIEHGKRIGFRPSVQIVPSQGAIGPASAVHKPSAPVTAVPTLHGRPGRQATKHGRATVPMQTRKPNGIGVPRSPMVPSPQDDNSPDQQ